MAVQPRIATKICRVPASAACARELPTRMCRAMFSTTTMESSTSRAERDDEAGNRNLVQRIAEEVEQVRPNASDSGIDTITMPAARQPSGSSVSNTSAMAMPKSRYRWFSRCDTLRDWSKPAFQLDALRQILLEALEGRLMRSLHVEDVVAVLLIRGDEDRALAVEAADVAVRLPSPSSRAATSRTRTMRPPTAATTVSRTWSSELVAAGGLQTEAARTRDRGTRRGCWRSRSVVPASPGRA